MKFFCVYTDNNLRINDDRWWATAAVYAHRAYGDPDMLSHAVDTWNHVSNLYVFCHYTGHLVNLKCSSAITPAQASAGQHPAKTFTLAGTCDGSKRGYISLECAAD